ncbi:MAG: alpha-L-fucosidase [Clostridia bacterium]|nr:alpha-L-fucosidase [Clostridia bacterium]
MLNKENSHKKTEWFTNDRFGMFIHWGLYSIPARGEWVRSVEEISVEDYQKYFDAFDPTDYDPGKWARIAKDAGMKYAVLTAKHHDGFCLFDSKLTDYKATNTRAKRDLVREYVEAFRAEGLKVGLYYSLVDWHHPEMFVDSARHPMRNNEAFRTAPRNVDKYLDYMHGQVEELCTNYGQIDLMWFDFSYDDFVGEGWRATELVRMMRKHQPNILINSRLEYHGQSSILTGNPKEYTGDFMNPEKIVPPEGIVDINGDPVVWEACVTTNIHWSYNRTDKNFKTSDILIKKLVECVSKGGNLLLNVGPTAKGSFPSEAIAALGGVGDWMKQNSNSIYGCGNAGLPKPEYGRITKKKNILYYHIHDGFEYIPLPGVNADQIKRIWRVSTGEEIKINEEWMARNFPEYVFIAFREDAVLLDPVDTVIGVELTASPPRKATNTQTQLLTP